MLNVSTILDKINGKPRPPPSPQIKDGKMARFCPSRGFILDLGGMGFAVSFYFVQDCSLRGRLECINISKLTIKAVVSFETLRYR